MENNKRLEELKEQFSKLTSQMIRLEEESHAVVRQIFELQKGDKSQ